MTTRQINDMITSPNGRAVHYFNGRILSAEDLSAEQDFNREERHALARAIGEGIAYGLEVRQLKETAVPTVRISAGMAINHSGATLHLAQDVDVALGRVAPPPPSTDGAEFRECGNLTDTDAYIHGQGLYLLTMYPVETREGSARTSGLNNTIAECNSKYRVKGVRFRRIQIPTASLNMTAVDLLRNQLAYKCFGSDAYQSAYADLASTSLFSGAYGLLDQMRPNALTNCDVPLAVVYMTASDGLVFVDMWSVRRRVTAPATYGWPMLNDRRAAEGESMMMQFTDQINHLRDRPTSLNTINHKARTYFRYLPAAGVIPISRTPSQRGFSEVNFFDGITTRGALTSPASQPIVIEGALIEPLLRDWHNYPPLDLDTGVMLWVYHVRENMQAEASGIQPYVVFTSGHMPFVGNGRFNVNRWNNSNFVRPDIGGG